MAYNAGDLGGLEARARMHTAAELSPHIIEGTPSQAAMWAAPVIGDRHALLAPLAMAAAHWDCAIATTAALSARTIARELTPAELESFEVLGVDLDVWIAAWSTRALSQGARNDVRVLAAEVVFALGGLRGTPAAGATNTASKAMNAIATAFRASPDEELHRVIADLEILLSPQGAP